MMTKLEFVKAYGVAYDYRFGKLGSQSEAARQAAGLYDAVKKQAAGGFWGVILQGIIDALPVPSVAEQVNSALGGASSYGVLTTLVENGILTTDQIKGTR